MDKITKEIGFNILLTIITIIICIAIFFIVVKRIDDNCCICGTMENKCCPCPNDEWFDIVNNWSDYKASSAGSWLTICEEYQEANNITFNCFE